MSLGKKARDSICKELVGLHNIKCWRPIRYSSQSIKQKKKMIRYFMFLKEKYNSDGDFDKLKSRLVAGGNMQDRSEYTEAEVSSPLASLSSVYMVAAIAAKENRKVGTVDVGMEREVITNLESRLASILLEELPSYGEFVNDDGSLTMVLQQALYGLVEFSKLWYDTLTGFLKSLGFEPNPKDVCIFNQEYEGNQLTLPTCSDDAGIDWIFEQLRKKFKDVTTTRGSKHSFLDQTFDFSVKGECSITVEGYTTDLLEMRSTTKTVSTLSLEDLFIVDEISSIVCLLKPTI